MYKPSIIDYQVARLLKVMTVADMVEEANKNLSMDLDAFWKYIAVARYIEDVIGD